ncbi:hypothetical protein H1R20_g10014, partial [Candolleomyces eurysporus]
MCPDGKLEESLEALLELPLELWIDILRLAGQVPDPLEYPLVIHPACSSNILSSYARKRYRDALATKKHILGVCRQWYALTIPFLYEHIVIENLDTMQRILAVVDGLPTIREPDDTQKLGCFIKRLDLVVPELQWTGNGDSTYPYSLAPQLCKLAPNLITLNTSSTGDARSFPLSNVISPRLEYLYWINTFRLPVSQWVTFMDAHPRLKFIDPPFFSSSSSDCEGYQAPWRTTQWPSLRELVLHQDRQSSFWASDFPPGAFPNLQKIEFTYRTMSSHLKEVLSVHGAALTSLHLHFGDLDFAVMFPVLETMATYCPHLDELMVSFAYLPLKQDVDLPPTRSKTRIVPRITILALQHNGEQYKDFGACALLWVNICPTIKTIRIFDETNVIQLKEQSEGMVEEFLKNCTSRLISVEDNFGNLLN